MTSTNDPRDELDTAWLNYLRRLDSGTSFEADELINDHPACGEELRDSIDDDLFARSLSLLSVPTLGSSGEGSGDTQRYFPDEERKLNDPSTEFIKPEALKLDIERRCGVGSVLDDYELIERIARGGMGIIYKARQRSLNRIVAVKVIGDAEFSDESAIDRFQSEAQAAARLKHRNIVAIHEIGEQKGVHYFSMDYVPGGSLANLLAEGPLAPAVAARYILKICDAIAYAHQHGIVHRDIKPSNVLIDAESQPLVSDFGLAREIGEMSELTRTGEILGTPTYMAPEQTMLSRTPPGPAADIYSIGALLYALLTGSSPFEAATPFDVLMQVRHMDPVRPGVRQPGIPTDLETICLKCLEKSPERRYRTVQDLSADIERHLDGHPILARRAGIVERTWRWCRRKPLLAAITTMLALLVCLLTASVVQYGVALQRFNSRLSEANDELAVNNTRLQALIQAESVARQRAQSSERRVRKLLYAADMRLASQAWEDQDILQLRELLHRNRPGPSRPDLRGIEWHLLHNLTTHEHNALWAHSGDVYWCQFSPDGKWLASVGMDGTLKLFEADSLEKTIVVDAGQGEVNHVEFSPDGTHCITAGDDGRLCFWSLPDGKFLKAIDAHPGRIAFQSAYSPDGTLLASCGQEKFVRLWNPETGEALGQLGPEVGPSAPRPARNLDAIAFSPDGRFIAAAGVYAVVWDVETRKRHFRKAVRSRVTSIDFSPDGRWLSVGSLDNRAYLIEIAAENRDIAESQHYDAVQAVAFDPTGRFAADADRAGNVRLWKMELLEQEQRDIRAPRNRPDLRPFSWPAHDGRVWSISFAPDGKTVATSGADGSVCVWPIEQLGGARILNPDGSPSNPANVQDFAFFADGSLAAVTPDHVYRQIDETSDFRQFSSARDGEVFRRIGTDQIGRWVAVGTEDGTILIQDAATGETVSSHRPDIAEGMRLLSLTPDGSRLIAVVDAILFDLTVPDLQPHPNAVPQYDCNAVSLSSDGRLLAVSPRVKDTIEIWNLETGEQLHEIPRQPDPVHAMQFGPDGSTLASSSNRLVRLWDVETGRIRSEFVGHQAPVASLCFDQSGRSLISTSEAHTIRVWSIELKQEVLALGWRSDRLDGSSVVCVSPDGERLLQLRDGSLLEYRIGSSSD
ncbi:Serine/threonine-protein kinase PknB [Maioricimonas rarisocia]|uniref:Serine/threonine-protein kinase PknB n=1 Tax=Maioricimonas rarisocia TaxID=2528026 RepID=A0A517ZEP8_9PLAN|nr:protein kinase [Maioricimonas rarisocia]QDU40938.1 Serine/threonine-protein kinase PknB [Maioricimonas rarisocia]